MPTPGQDLMSASEPMLGTTRTATSRLRRRESGLTVTVVAQSDRTSWE